MPVGPNWTVRNRGIKTGSDDLGIGCAVTDPNGTGLIEHVYIKNTQTSDTTAIWVHPDKHRGHLTIRNVHIEGVADNAIYSENMPPHGDGGGRVEIEDCYLHDNTRANLRISGNTEVRNTHIHNTGNNFPTSGYTSAGHYTWYEGSGKIRLRHCQIDIDGRNTRNGVGYASKIFAETVLGSYSSFPEMTIENSQVNGSIIDPANQITLENTGNNPQINPPAGVPMTMQEARNGTSSATGPTWSEVSDGTGGGGGGGGGGTSLADIVNDDGENEITIRPQ